MNLSPELRVKFATLPSRLLIAGEASCGVEFASVDPVAQRAAAERLERARRLEAEERARAESALRDRRFEDAVKSVAELSRTLRDELSRELTALEPEFARLALRIAERAVRAKLENDPLLLSPAIEGAMKRLRAGLDEPALVSLHVAASDAERFAAEFASHGAPVRVVPESSFEPGRFEARCDIRRIRFSVSRELESLATGIETEQVDG